jgi:hypothetical protein
MVGSLSRPSGQLLTNGVVYIPPIGIERSSLQDTLTTSSIVDTFSFTASDCEAETEEHTSVSVLPSLTPVNLPWMTYSMSITPTVATTYSLPLADIHSCKLQFPAPPMSVHLFSVSMRMLWCEIVVLRTAAKSSNSIISLIGLQLLNASIDTTWLYSPNSSSSLSINDWLSHLHVNSTMITAPSSAPTFVVNAPLTLSAPSIILGAHIRVMESSSITSPRTYTWMLRIKIDITLQCSNGMVLHPQLQHCIDCTTLPYSILNSYSSIDRLVYLHNTCPLYGTSLCSSTTPIDVPCVEPAVLSSTASSSILGLTIALSAFVLVAALAVLKWRRTRSLYASSPLFLALGNCPSFLLCSLPSSCYSYIGLFVGGPLILASVIIMTRNPTVDLCTAKHWCLHIGATLVLMTLALKNYRLHYIYNRKIFGGMSHDLMLLDHVH